MYKRRAWMLDPCDQFALCRPTDLGPMVVATKEEDDEHITITTECGKRLKLDPNEFVLIAFRLRERRRP